MIRLGFLDGRLWLISIRLFYDRSHTVKLTISNQYKCLNLLTFNDEIISENWHQNISAGELVYDVGMFSFDSFSHNWCLTPN